ncbi:MAG: EutN/CcmL family microcompartment protein [Planctomycetia bacterium]|nr:EutN/CcmL family microcompartment protein [Planctomycetia bacterium]
MQRALILGNATSVAKHDSLNGQKMLLAIALATDGVHPEGDPLLVFDNLGAGSGDIVLISSDGSYTGNVIIGTRTTPARWGVIGIVDPLKPRDVS